MDHHSTLIRRWHSPTLFVLIGLCFLLPFATVSCEETETTFTGAQLATWTVPDDGTTAGVDLRMQVEDAASALAAATLAVAGLGFVLGALGLRGAGWCAAAGLVTTLLLAGKALDPLGPAVAVHEGYTLTFLLFVWASVLHGVRAWRARRRRGVPVAAAALCVAAVLAGCGSENPDGDAARSEAPEPRPRPHRKPTVRRSSRTSPRRPVRPGRSTRRSSTVSASRPRSAAATSPSSVPRSPRTSSTAWRSSLSARASPAMPGRCSGSRASRRTRRSARKPAPASRCSPAAGSPPQR